MGISGWTPLTAQEYWYFRLSRTLKSYTSSCQGVKHFVRRSVIPQGTHVASGVPIDDHIYPVLLILWCFTCKTSSSSFACSSFLHPSFTHQHPQQSTLHHPLPPASPGWPQWSTPQSHTPRGPDNDLNCNLDFDLKENRESGKGQVRR